MSLVDPNTPEGVQPRGLSGFPTLTFSDEFEDSSLNTERWLPWYPDATPFNQTVPGGHKTNSNEPQGYDASGLDFPGDGTLRMTMREGNFAVPELPFSSGMVSSGGKFAQAYGVFEARIKVPREAGSWGAFWLFPAANTWEYEIDIMENWGADAWNTSTLHTVHTKLQAAQSEGYNMGEDVGVSWHTYTLWWEPDRIRIFVDGNLAADWTEAEIGYVYEKPMYLLMNLAGSVSDPTWADLYANTPFSMEASYVRVWSLSETGVVDPSSVPPTNPGDHTPEPEPEPSGPTSFKDVNGNPLYPYGIIDGTYRRLT